MKRFITTRETRTGFTLIELMVVISLMAIVLSIVLPRFQGVMLDDDLNSAVRTVANTVRQQKERAQQDQRDYGMTIDIDTKTFEMKSLADDDGETGVLARFQLPSAVTLVAVEFPDQGIISSGTVYIRFFKTGYSDQAIIHLQDSDYRHQTLLIEPFLPELRILDGYKTYENL